MEDTTTEQSTADKQSKAKKTQSKPEKQNGKWLATINGVEGYYNRNQIEVAMKSAQSEVEFPKNTTFSTSVKSTNCQKCGRRRKK
jgi:hypothetical protein